MIEGVIYKYTSPSNKIYIGQTTNEARRRAEWFYLKMYYSHKGPMWMLHYDLFLL